MVRAVNSVLQMVLCGALFVLLIAVASALEIGARPPVLLLEGETEHVACGNITLMSDANIDLDIEVSMEGVESIVLEHGSINHSRREVDVPVCFFAKRSGTYEGLVIFLPSAGTVGLGVHVIEVVRGESREILSSSDSMPYVSLRAETQERPTFIIFLFLGQTLELAMLVGILWKTLHTSITY